MTARGCRRCSPLVTALLLTVAVPGRSADTIHPIHRAMRAEIARSLQGLRLPDLAAPFYVAYTLRDVHTLSITATLGGLVESTPGHDRELMTRVMVGDYALNDENFGGLGGFGHGAEGLRIPLPLVDDEAAIRRALWASTDGLYKAAAEQLERKKAAMRAQNIGGAQRDLPDFTPAPKIEFSARATPPTPDRARFEALATRLSAQFVDHPQIFSSQVRLLFYWAEIDYANSEGTLTSQPVACAALLVNAATQAEDGTPLSDHVLRFAAHADDLPTEAEAGRAVATLIANLEALRAAPIFEDNYTGPVLFEGQAAAELVAQRLFSGGNGLLAQRRPLLADPRSAAFVDRLFADALDKRIGRRILARDLQILATPTRTRFQGTELLGAFTVDAEGVRPPERLVLVDKGLLQTLLNNRTPVPKVRQSNGHQRPLLGLDVGARTALGPGVVELRSQRGSDDRALRSKLKQLARGEGLDYALVVRKLAAPVSGVDQRLDPLRLFQTARPNPEGDQLSAPLQVFKLDLKSGRETLVRGARLGPVTVAALRHIAGASKAQQAYNTLVPVGAGFGGMRPGIADEGAPASFIVPQAILLEELDVERGQTDFTPLLPSVPSPLTAAR